MRHDLWRVTLPGPSRKIIVVPVERPEPVPDPAPAPAPPVREPTPEPVP